MKKKNIIIFLAMISLIPGMIHANEDKTGFYEGRWFLGLGIGTGFNIYGTPASISRNFGTMPEHITILNQYDTIGYYTINFGTTEQKIVNAYVLDSSPKPELKSYFAGIDLEYALFKNVSIGLKIKKQSYNLKNTTLSKLGYGFLYSMVVTAIPNLRLTASELIAIETMLPLIRSTQENVLEANFLELMLNYHPVQKSSWDPYIGIHAGYGERVGNSLDNDLLTRYGSVFGIRYFITPNWTTSLEFDYSQITKRKNSNLNLKEESAQIKIGYAF